MFVYPKPMVNSQDNKLYINLSHASCV